MATFLLSLVIIIAALAGLGLGSLCGRPGLRGSCGGIAGDGRRACACSTRNRGKEAP